MKSASTKPRRVSLLHDYRERSQISMKLYAESLGASLEARGWMVEHVRVPDVFPAAVQRFWLPSKLDSLIGRYVVYPDRVRELRADIVHIVDHGQGHLTRHVDSERTVVTVHDVILLVLASGRIGPLKRPRFAETLLQDAMRAVGTARRIITVSEQTKRDITELCGVDPRKIRVIPNGLSAAFKPVEGARAAVRTRLGLGERKIVLHVSSASFYKNIQGCLRVVAELRDRGLDVVFIRVGERMRREDAALAARLRLSDSVIELGRLSTPDLVATYNVADALLFPSLYEGFGWPPLEAMACGTPAVCSRSGALPETVGQAALLADARDVHGLADRVQSVLCDRRTSETLRARGFAHARRFSWEETGRAVSAVYREVIGA